MNEATREEARGTEEEQLAALTLSCMARPLLRHRVGTIREAGSCRAALERLEIPVSAHREAEENLERSLRRGFRLLCLTDSSYPPALSEAPDPPICLFIWGELLDDDELSISVVGSRRATPYGLSITRRIVAQLVEAGLTVTSGLARGIDGAAHRAAVEAGGRSLAVLGSGLENLYPREHRGLAARIAENGAVLSEFPMDEPPRGKNFPRRNRIISGLSLGTLVVEAAERSGSLISARHAMDQNREVFAVPGPVDAPASAGTLALIKDGAKLVTGAEDIIEELRPDVRARLAPISTTSAPGRAVATGTDYPAERQVLSTMAVVARALDVDELVDGTGLSIPQSSRFCSSSR